MKILGIDPGFSSLGWAVIDFDDFEVRSDGCGVIRTKVNKLAKKHDDNVERCGRYGMGRNRLDIGATWSAGDSDSAADGEESLDRKTERVEKRCSIRDRIEGRRIG